MMSVVFFLSMVCGCVMFPFSCFVFGAMKRNSIFVYKLLVKLITIKRDVTHNTKALILLLTKPLSYSPIY